ncbi:AraC family transcriptional regulator [bacterium]|nr:AraC family transcriptional regulator [bacterium]
MASKSSQSADRDARRMQTDRDELAERILRAVPEDASLETQPGLYLSRYSSPSKPVQLVYEPMLCVIAQGSKDVLVGSRRYHYDAAHYLIACVELPAAARIVEATREKPFLGLRLDLDPTLIASLMIEARSQTHRETDMNAMDVSRLDAGLLDAIVRLVRLLDSPAEFRVLAPLVTREIIYRLLMGEQGDRLRQLVASSGRTQYIARAIGLLRQSFDQPLRIESMARKLGMSVSSFHHHFKTVTAMSPLQFQKKLRLHEARRLMLGEDLDAAQAGFRVGYEDASHFNRDYKRLFGEPPLRDVELLREAARR